MGLWATIKGWFRRAPQERTVIEAVVVPTPRPQDSDLAPGTLALVEDFRNHLRTHAESQQNLSQMLTSVSATLHALPELARQQGRVLETLMEAAARARQRDQAVERGLVQLSEGADRQTQVLGLVQQQLDLNHETTIQVSDSLRDLASALGALSSNSERHTRAIENLAETTRRRTDQSDRLERRLQGWMIAVASIGTAAVLAVLWLVMHMPSVPAISQGPASNATGTALETTVTPPTPDGSSAASTGSQTNPSAAPSTGSDTAANPEPQPKPEPEPEPLPPPKGVGDALPDLEAEKAKAEKEAIEKQGGAAPEPTNSPPAAESPTAAPTAESPAATPAAAPPSDPAAPDLKPSELAPE